MHKTFLSYHHANEQDLKDEIIETYGGELFIDKSVSDGDISTNVSDNYIMRKIREDYLGDSTVTVVLIGTETANRPFVNSEIQASLWGDNPAGLLGVIRDEIYSSVFSSGVCDDTSCNCGIGIRTIEWGYEHYLPWLIKNNHRYSKVVPHYEDTDVYCSLVKYSDFISDCEFYINQAFDKRSAMEPASKRNPPDVSAIRTSSLW
ncbi:TIR domain-containing protein [Candidatus Symbiopectobacterium sp. NZEC127]|uniref:TIR domain-containing protein n=1 Tax=Candidatus Symbiopectobacterium sp. NZEC127 TaxID=2820472 RepID=UPI00222701FA|nr:TIR domain-containing protein [Candidatus Symbiopectobacterium sp. NZEC127]MCW2484424.1 TIR domain-containing protein [Candidatus Symbiopectobacterium sp. NZEC127]